MAAPDVVRILLVDDRADSLLSLRATLASPDYEIVTATSGREALRWLLDEDCAMILLDVQMPDMDGIETAELIKKSPRLKDVPIVFLTASDDDPRRVLRGYEAGAVDYIAKPFVPEVLRSKVAVFAALHRSRRTILRQQQELREREEGERRRHIAELELRALRREQLLERRYRELVEGLPHVVVWTADPTTGALTFVSPSIEHLAGVSPDELRARAATFADLVAAQDRALVHDTLAGLVEERAVAFEHRMGGDAWFHTRVKLERRIDDDGLELRGFSVDTTAQRRAQDALIEALQVRDDFLSVASHELKTPLTPLKMQIESVRRTILGGAPRQPEAVAAKLDIADRQVDRLVVHVDRLLDVARMRAGRLELEQAEHDLVIIAADVIARFESEAQRRGTRITLSGAQNVVGWWDRHRLDQVLTNLLSNALKYGDGEPVDVEVKADGDVALMSVRDHGIGIPAHDVDRIFARFERAVTTKHFGGLGLGLFIADQIVAAHGGRIDVDSVPGNGSTFTVRLPRAGASAGAARASVDPGRRAS